MPAVTPACPVSGFCVQRDVASKGVGFSLLAHRLPRPAPRRASAKDSSGQALCPLGFRSGQGCFNRVRVPAVTGLPDRPRCLACRGGLSARARGRSGFGVSRRGSRSAPEAGRRRGAVGGYFSSGGLPANRKASQQRQTKVFPHRLRGVPRPTMRAVDLASLVGTRARFSNLGCRASKGNRMLPLGN